MDFFASAYTSPSLNQPNQPHHHHHDQEKPCQGYGCEANAHLRRASLGLESDVTSPRSHQSQFSFGQIHHKNYDSNDTFYNKDKNNDANNGSKEGCYFMLHENTPSPPPKKLPTSPKRAVSNPCLLHHTNSYGDGVVQTPVMPTSFSFHLKQGSTISENPISEEREAG
ncbi:hypothetical protein BGZ46_003363, partial [Entomortierella lignicola]